MPRIEPMAADIQPVTGHAEILIRRWPAGVAALAD